jgi:hypothetical protein
MFPVPKFLTSVWSQHDASDCSHIGGILWSKLVLTQEYFQKKKAAHKILLYVLDLVRHHHLVLISCLGGGGGG